MQLLVVNEVRAHRIHNQVKEYLVHWDGYNSDEDTWESEKYLSCDEKISLFWSRFRHNKNHDAGPWIPPVDPLIPVVVEVPLITETTNTKLDVNANPVISDIKKRKKRQKKEKSKKKEGGEDKSPTKKIKKNKKEGTEEKKKEKKDKKDKLDKKKRFKPTAETTTDDAYQRNEFEGVTCHQCRQKTTDTKAICVNHASHAFCKKCLRNRYNINLEELPLEQNQWVCPRCTDECNCSICRKKQGKPPLTTKKAAQKNV